MFNNLDKANNTIYSLDTVCNVYSSNRNLPLRKCRVNGDDKRFTEEKRVGKKEREMKNKMAREGESDA